MARKPKASRKSPENVDAGDTKSDQEEDDEYQTHKSTSVG